MREAQDSCAAAVLGTTPGRKVKTVCSHPLQARQVLVQIPYHVSILRGADDAESVGQMICEKADELRAVAIIMASAQQGTACEVHCGVNHAVLHTQQPCDGAGHAE